LPVGTLFNRTESYFCSERMSDTIANRDFALLVGRAFLHEIEAGHRDAALAFGRAFLIALGKKGPDEEVKTEIPHHKVHELHQVAVEN